MDPLPLAVVRSFSTLGLSEKEIIVLSCLYNAGRIKAYDIYKRQKSLTRPQVYKILTSLTKQQLVMLIRINDKNHYELKSNAEIVRWASRKRLEAEEHKELCETSMRQIQSFLTTRIQSPHTEPSFYHLKGEKGLEYVSKLLATAKGFDIYLNLNELKKLCPNYMDFLKRVFKKDDPESKVRCLMTTNTNHQIPKELQDIPQLFLRLNSNPGEGPILFLGDNWLIQGGFSGEEFVGMYVTSLTKNFLKIFRAMFEKEWELAKAPKATEAPQSAHLQTKSEPHPLSPKPPLLSPHSP
ncbi:hypothetical protein HOG48_02975 [Candidatus Peregrinibacteria bacterium]|jgi:Fe2+ or Zn2+ uptake regulation protein|nr:hypothetical protein [Candidatus Peregrinibacteria bacterium]